MGSWSRGVLPSMDGFADVQGEARSEAVGAKVGGLAELGYELQTSPIRAALGKELELHGEKRLLTPAKQWWSLEGKERSRSSANFAPPLKYPLGLAQKPP